MVKKRREKSSAGLETSSQEPATEPARGVMVFGCWLQPVLMWHETSWLDAHSLKIDPLSFTYHVYKHGELGRSIDVSRYSGYEELKQDLGRTFGIESEVEDEERFGWKLVCVDHQNDVLLVGDDPWEEFVSYVRCIKILSSTEVQQMSLDGDFG